jgi:hypothetical protein
VCRRPEKNVIECKELAGKVIRDCNIYEDGSDGPEVLIEFTDDTTFSVCLKTTVSVDAKCLLDEGGQPQVIKAFKNSPTA